MVFNDSLRGQKKFRHPDSIWTWIAIMNSQYDTLILVFEILPTRPMFVIKLLINAYRLISNKLVGLIKPSRNCIQCTHWYTLFGTEKFLPIEFFTNHHLRLVMTTRHQLSYENGERKFLWPIDDDDHISLSR